MVELSTLRGALIEELKDLYSAEQQILQTLPKMLEWASNNDLKSVFQANINETREQVNRLEQIAHAVESKLSGKTCQAMRGLLEEVRQTMDTDSDNEELLDALLVGSAQRVKHYEIAAYGAARAIADALGEEEIADLLDKSLAEESATDERLSAIIEEDILPDLARIDSELREPM